MYPPAGPDPLATAAAFPSGFFASLGVVAAFVAPDGPRAGKEALCEMTPGFFTFEPAAGALQFDALAVFLAPLASPDPPFCRRNRLYQ
jgi:hypothetical protein